MSTYSWWFEVTGFQEHPGASRRRSLFYTRGDKYFHRRRTTTQHWLIFCARWLPDSTIWRASLMAEPCSKYIRPIHPGNWFWALPWFTHVYAEHVLWLHTPHWIWGCPLLDSRMTNLSEPSRNMMLNRPGFPGCFFTDSSNPGPHHFPSNIPHSFIQHRCSPVS